MKIPKEEYTESQGSSKVSRYSKQDIYEIDRVLNQMQAAFKANLEAQQTFLDIIKRKNKNINSNYIKLIYALFTQNKANQICFQKEAEMFVNMDWDEKLLRRYYARLVEMGIRKISYYWLNSQKLDFLSTIMVKLMREIYSCFNDIQKLKNLDAHINILKLLFDQSSMIEQKIYELLIDDGYLMSMDEFYRINGVDLVGDRSYQGKKTTMQSQQQSQQQIVEVKKQKIREPRLSKVKIMKETKKLWQPKAQAELISNVTPIQAERNKSKIKTMIQQIVTVIKQTIQQEDAKDKHLQVIVQQNYANVLTQRDYISSTQQIFNKIDKNRKRISKPENIFIPQFKKRSNDKKMSIQVMSYFSNQFKSVISEVQEVDIRCLSEMLVESEKHTNSKPIPVAILGRQTNEPYIHSLRSLESNKKIKEQKKRGKLMEMAILRQHSEFYNHIYEDISKQSAGLNFPIQKAPSNFKLHKQKFSYRSAPGVYISFMNQTENNKVDNKVKKQKRLQRNKFVVYRQNYEKQQLFQNQLIVNQLISKQQQKAQIRNINFTNVSGADLKVGIGNLRLFGIKSQKNKYTQTQNTELLKQLQIKKWVINANNNQLSQQLNHSQSQITNKENDRIDLKQEKQTNQVINRKQNKSNNFRVCSSKNKQNKQIKATQMRQTMSVQRNRTNYTVYDRCRRLIIMER